MSSVLGLPNYYIGLSHENVRGLYAAQRIRPESPYRVLKIPMVGGPEETKEAFFIRLDVSGVRPDDIAVVFSENMLIIELEKEFDPFKLAHSSWDKAFGIFRRKFTVPRGCTPSNVYYKVEDGLLEVIFLKEARKKSGLIRRIFSERPKSQQTDLQ